MLLDEFMPAYDVSDSVATVVDADPAATWSALREVDLIEVGKRKTLVAILGGLRALPDLASHLMHGERPASLPEKLTLRDTIELPMDGGGWVLLGENQGEEITLGLVGKFWKPVIEFAEVPREEFRDFDEPGFAKTIYSLAVSPLDGDRTLLTGTMRTATTDEHARRWFQRYWTLGVGSGAHVLVQGLLDLTREGAETRVAV
jgi:hypothetical protein